MAAEKNIERIPGYCALCTSVCGCVSVVEDGRLVAVEPDPAHPTGKALCGKGRAAPELVYHEDRLLHPLRRVSPKDEAGKWERISWDEALDETAEALRRLAAEHGPESVAFAITTPSGTGIQDAYPWIERLRHAYGSPNAPYGTEICNFHRDDINRLTFGVDTPVPDFENARCIMLWGHQPEHHLARLCEPRRRGQGAGRQAHRRRSAPRGPRGQGRRLAPRAPRHRRRARARPRQPAAGGRALRRRLHADLDQRPAAGARGRRHAAPRRSPERGGRACAPRRLGCGRRRADALRPRRRPLRRRNARARRPLRGRRRGRRGHPLPHRIRLLPRALPRVHAGARGGDHLGAGGAASRGGKAAGRGGRGLLLQLVPAWANTPTRARPRAPSRSSTR